jgi:spore coat-associated protein N
VKEQNDKESNRMSRISSLMKASPRKTLGAVGVLIAAAALAVGSGANFNSTSSNPSNVFTAGNLAHTNSKAGAAIMTAANMKPGDTSVGTVDIKNTGNISGTFTLTKSNLVDTPASPAFSGKLTLSLDDMGDPTCVSSCPAAVNKYSGTVAAMGTLSMGTFVANENHRYRFTVTFPDGGANGADNAYKSASTSVEYDWTSSS